jgi:glycosyltransferase involved in cell wall biosynthesis
MNALFISNDPKLLDPASAVRARMRSYAGAIGALHIICRASKGELIEDEVSGGKLCIEVVSAQDPFEHGWIAARALKGTAARLHIQIHTDFLSRWFLRDQVFRSPKVPVPLLNRIRILLADYTLPRAHAIRAVSMRVRTSVVERYGGKIVAPSVLPITPPIDDVPAVPLPEHAFTFALITVCRLEPEKRIEDILFALARIGLRYAAVGLVIVGEGSERKRLEHLARTLGIEKRVLFLGERADARGLMKSAQAYIQASAYEGYGMTLIEAALAGIPIITTDVGIVGEVFAGYRDVLAAPPGDPAALATHIMGIVEDHQARELFTQAAELAARNHLAQYSDQPTRVAADLARTLPSA